MHRFFVHPDQISGDSVRFRREQAHQLHHVLRLHPGGQVIVLDGRGQQYDVALQQVDAHAAGGRILRSTPAEGEPRTQLTLYQSLLKREKFEWVLQKGTEIGVVRFVPVITRRTLVRDLDAVTAEKRERWQRIIAEAAEQSGRGRLPALADPVPFAAALADAVATTQRAVIARGEATSGKLATALAGLPEAARVGLFVGPEGGYDPAEVAEAQAAGIAAVSLGARILRTETAALVGPALILHVLGDAG